MSLINCFSFISNNIEKTITLEKPLPSITEPINVNLPTLPFVPQNNYYLDKLQNELEKKSLLQSNDGTVNIASFNSTLPDFSKTKIRRLSLLLSKIFTIKIYDNIEIKISPISILKEHNRFCKEKNIPVQAIEIVGSAVFYILGASYITKLLTIKGIEKKLLTSKILEIFTSPPSDYDIRIHFSLINNENFRSLLENFNKIISQLIENLIKEKVPEINNYRLQEILYRILPKSALFNNVKNIYTINRITPDDSFPFEFLGIYKQERAHLFAGDALRLKTADANLIKKDKVFSAPTFESSWNNQLQPLFDRLLRLIRSDNIDTINYRSWSNYISLLSKGYRCVDEKLEIAIIEALDNEILYDRLGNKRNLTDKICFLISHALENHVSTTPSNIFALTFIATEMLMYHKKINIKEALDIWDYLCHRFNVFQQPSPNEELSFASKMMALSFGDEPNSLTHFVVHYLDILGITSIPNQLDLYHSSHIGKPIIIAELLFSHPNGHATSSSSLNPYLQVDYNPPYALDNGIKTLMILYDNGNNKALDEVFTILDSLTCHDCIDDNSLSKNPYSLEWTYSFMESKIWLLQYLGMRIIIKKDLKELPVSTLIAFIQYFPKIIINSKLSQNFWLKSCIHFLNRVNEDKKINENDWNETVDSLFNGSSQLSAAIYEKWLYALIKTKSTMIINAIVASWKNKQYPFSEYLWVICGKNILKLINDTHLFDSLSILYALHENQSIGIAEKHSFLYKLLPLMSSETHVQRYPNSFFEKSYRVFFDNFNANYKSINRSQIFEIADFYLNILKNFNIPSMAELFIFCLNNDLFLDQEPILLNHLSFLNENNENIDLDTIWNHLLINKIILTLKSSIWSSLFLNAAQSSIVDKQLPSCRDLFKQQITTLDINFIATDDISLYKTLLREYPKKELSDSLIDQFANHKSAPSFALVLIKNYLKRNTFKKAIEAIKTAPLETFSIEEVFELNSLISKLIGKLKERLSFQDNREQSIVLVHELLNTVCGKRWTNENPYIAIDVLIELFNHHSDKISQSTHVYFISFFAILCSLLRQYNTFFVRIVCQNENIITIINKYLKNNWHPSTSSSLRKNLFDIFFDFTEHCISVNDYHNYFSFIDHYCLYTSDKNCKIENKKWFETAFITYFLENDDVYPSENIFKLAFEIVAPSQLFRSLQKNLQFNNNLPFFNIQQWTNRLLNIKQTKASPEFALIFSEAAITHDYDDDAIKLTDTVISNINYLKHSKIICNIIDNLSDNLKKNNFTQKIKTYSFFLKIFNEILPNDNSDDEIYLNYYNDFIIFLSKQTSIEFIFDDTKIAYIDLIQSIEKTSFQLSKNFSTIKSLAAEVFSKLLITFDCKKHAFYLDKIIAISTFFEDVWKENSLQIPIKMLFMLRHFKACKYSVLIDPPAYIMTNISFISKVSCDLILIKDHVNLCKIYVLEDFYLQLSSFDSKILMKSIGALVYLSHIIQEQSCYTPFPSFLLKIFLQSNNKQCLQSAACLIIKFLSMHKEKNHVTISKQTQEHLQIFFLKLAPRLLNRNNFDYKSSTELFSHPYFNQTSVNHLFFTKKEKKIRKIIFNECHLLSQQNNNNMQLIKEYLLFLLQCINLKKEDLTKISLMLINSIKNVKENSVNFQKEMISIFLEIFSLLKIQNIITDSRSILLTKLDNFTHSITYLLLGTMDQESPEPFNRLYHTQLLEKEKTKRNEIRFSKILYSEISNIHPQEFREKENIIHYFLKLINSCIVIYIPSSDITENDIDQFLYSKRNFYNEASFLYHLSWVERVIKILELRNESSTTSYLNATINSYYNLLQNNSSNIQNDIFFIILRKLVKCKKSLSIIKALKAIDRQLEINENECRQFFFDVLLSISNINLPLNETIDVLNACQEAIMTFFAKRSNQPYELSQTFLDFPLELLMNKFFDVWQMTIDKHSSGIFFPESSFEDPLFSCFEKIIFDKTNNKAFAYIKKKLFNPIMKTLPLLQLCLLRPSNVFQSAKFRFDKIIQSLSLDKAHSIYFKEEWERRKKLINASSPLKNYLNQVIDIENDAIIFSNNSPFEKSIPLIKEFIISMHAFKNESNYIDKILKNIFKLISHELFISEQLQLFSDSLHDFQIDIPQSLIEYAKNFSFEQYQDKKLFEKLNKLSNFIYKKTDLHITYLLTIIHNVFHFRQTHQEMNLLTFYQQQISFIKSKILKNHIDDDKSLLWFLNNIWIDKSVCYASKNDDKLIEDLITLMYTVLDQLIYHFPNETKNVISLFIICAKSQIREHSLNRFLDKIKHLYKPLIDSIIEKNGQTIATHQPSLMMLSFYLGLPNVFPKESITIADTNCVIDAIKTLLETDYRSNIDFVNTMLTRYRDLYFGRHYEKHLACNCIILDFIKKIPIKSTEHPLHFKNSLHLLSQQTKGNMSPDEKKLAADTYKAFVDSFNDILNQQNLTEETIKDLTFFTLDNLSNAMLTDIFEIRYALYFSCLNTISNAIITLNKSLSHLLLLSILNNIEKCYSLHPPKRDRSKLEKSLHEQALEKWKLETKKKFF